MGIPIEVRGTLNCLLKEKNSLFLPVKKRIFG